MGTSMNLTYAHQLLVAADDQPDHSFQVTGSRGCREVQWMAAAGLVEMSDHGSRAQPVVSIDHLTAFGQSFLRTFAAPPPLPTLRVVEEHTPIDVPAASTADARTKWRQNFIDLKRNEAL